MVHKWAQWLHNPYHLGSPLLQSGGQNQKCSTSKPSGYTPAPQGDPLFFRSGVFDPLCNKPYIVGANTEEVAIVNLIAEQEGIRPR